MNYGESLQFLCVIFFLFVFLAHDIYCLLRERFKQSTDDRKSDPPINIDYTYNRAATDCRPIPVCFVTAKVCVLFGDILNISITNSMRMYTTKTNV